MTHTLFFDTASTRFHKSKTTGEEPAVIRLAWWRDDEPEPVCRLIQPNPGTTIDQSTFAYHGLSLDRLQADGVPASDVIAELEKAAAGADALVAFNDPYHWRMLYKMMRVDAKPPANAVCAMKLAEPILAIQAMRPGGGLKSPNLREACAFFGVQPPSSPEDPIELALSTVRAVRGVYEGCLPRTG